MCKLDTPIRAQQASRHGDRQELLELGPAFTKQLLQTSRGLRFNMGTWGVETPLLEIIGEWSAQHGDLGLSALGSEASSLEALGKFLCIGAQVLLRLGCPDGATGLQCHWFVPFPQARPITQTRSACAAVWCHQYAATFFEAETRGRTTSARSGQSRRATFGS